jgi:hypothetical protein
MHEYFNKEFDCCPLWGQDTQRISVHRNRFLLEPPPPLPHHIHTQTHRGLLSPPNFVVSKCKHRLVNFIFKGQSLNQTSCQNMTFSPISHHTPHISSLFERCISSQWRGLLRWGVTMFLTSRERRRGLSNALPVADTWISGPYVSDRTTEGSVSEDHFWRKKTNYWRGMGWTRV